MPYSNPSQRMSGATHSISSRAQLFASVALLAFAALCAVAAPRASAISDSEELTRIGGIGTGAGQLSRPSGLASDPVTGHLFAVETGNGRVSEFSPWGDFVKAFGFDVAPGAVNEQQEVRVRASAGQFKLSFDGATTPDLPFDAGASEVEGALNALASIGPGASVSVKSVPSTSFATTPSVHVISFKGSLAATDVKQLEAANGTTVLSGGTPSTDLLVRTRADGTAGGAGLESCTAESGCKAGINGSGAGQLGDTGMGIAIDAVGNLYTKEADNDRVQKFDPAGRFVLMFGGKVDKTTNANRCTAASGDVCGIGLPGSGPEEFALNNNSIGLAFCPSGPLCGPDGALFVADVGRIQRLSLDGEYEGELSLPGKTVEGVAFDPVGEDLYASYLGGVHELEPSTAAEIGQPRKGSRLIATNPSGELFANFQNEEVLEFGPTGSPLSPPSCCAPPLLPPPNEFDAHFSLEGIGTNGAGDLHVANVADVDSFIRVFGPGPVIFEGPPPVPPTITAQFASSVQRDGASVAALINPHFFTDAHYRVQYGTGECATGGCPNEAPAAPQSLTTKVFGSPVRTAGIVLEGLTPGTTYHYRFVAESSGGLAFGAEANFTTPEPLSHPACPNEVFRGGASARLPDCRTYEMVSPVDKNNGDIKSLLDFISYRTKLGQASADGSRVTYSSSRSFGNPKGAPETNQYVARRGAAAWPSEAVSAGQGSGADLNATPNAIGNPYKLFSADLCTGWFVVAAEPLLDPGRDFLNYRNVYRRDFCNGEPDEALLPVKPTVGLEKFNPEPQGGSADGKATIVRVRDKLTPDAASDRWQTYYAHGGGLKLLCVLPDGTPSTGHCSGGSGSLSGAPGSQLIITDLNRTANVANAISADGQRVYWTESTPGVESGPGKVYLRINPGEEQSQISEGECTEAEKACTVEVSRTASTKASRFLTASPDGAKALFELTEGTHKGDLYLFDAGFGESTLIAGDVLGLAAASEDLSRVYFVSEEALDGTAVAGEPNLYLSEGEEEKEETFIATLSPDDVAGFVPSNTALRPIYHVARASTDGGELAFVSTRSLSGYDNADLATGVPDSEVYLYEVGSSGPVCVSCNPSGARPRGREVRGNVNENGILSAAGLLPVPDYMLNTSRALSEDGERLFFESFDALLPRDVNAAKDVYEWESAASKTACEQKGAELYVAASGGCLSLVSNGESPEDSEFLDASADGDDVFFITNASLLAQDPGLFDLYDARVGGGLPTPIPPPDCQGESCKPPVSAPDDPTPASSAYTGPGDLRPSATKPRKGCPKGKRKVRRAGKFRCVARQRGKSQRKRGADHDRRAPR